MFAPQGITLICLFPEGTRLFGTFGPSGQRIHLGLRAKGYETFWQIWVFRPKDTRLFGTCGPSGQRARDFLAHLGLQAKGYETFWHIWAFRPKGARFVCTFGPSGQRIRDFLAHLGLHSAGLEPEAISVPYPRYPMRPEGPMWGPKGPTMGMGGRGGVGWGAPKAPPYGIFHPLIIISPSLLSVRPLRAPIGLIN